MKKAVAERVTDNVLEVLKGMRVGPYHFQPTVEEWKPEGNTPEGDVFFVVKQSDLSENGEETIGFDNYDAPVSVTYRRVRGEADTNKTAKTLHAETFGGIKKALMQDDTRGGVAITTREWSGSAEDTEGAGTIEGVVSFTVWIRTVLNDVFTSAFDA